MRFSCKTLLSRALLLQLTIFSLFSVSACMGASDRVTVEGEPLQAAPRVIGFNSRGSGWIGVLNAAGKSVVLEPNQPDAWLDRSFLYNLASGKVSDRESHHGDCLELQSVCGSMSDQFYFAVYHGQLHEVDKASGLSSLIRLPVEGHVKAIAFDARKKLLAVVVGDDLKNDLRYWDHASQKWIGDVKVSVPHACDDNRMFKDILSMAYRKEDDSLYVLFGLLPLVSTGYPKPAGLMISRVTAAEQNLQELGTISGELVLPHCGLPIQLAVENGQLVIVTAPVAAAGRKPAMKYFALNSGTRVFVAQSCNLSLERPLQRISTDGFKSYFVRSVAPELKQKKALSSVKGLNGLGLVRLRIDRDGTVLNCDGVSQPATNDSVTNALLTMVKGAGHFAPLPEHWPASIDFELSLLVNARSQSVSPVLIRH